MTSTQTEKTWDFSQVYSLISTLSANDESSPRPSRTSPNRIGSSPRITRSSHNKNDVTVSDGLGDFSQIWQYLGSPADLPAPKVIPAPDASPTLEKRVPEKVEYTSDGAIYTAPAVKKTRGIQWRDEAAEGALTDVAPTKSDTEEKLSKAQRKKRNRREREKERENANSISATGNIVSNYESEAEVRPVSTPARKASNHNLKELVTPKQPVTKYALRPRDESGNAITSYTPQKSKKDDESKSPERTVAVPPSASTKAAVGPDRPASPTKSASRPVSKVARQRSEPIRQPDSTPVTKTTKQEWPVSNPSLTTPKSFLPASVQPPRHLAAEGNSPIANAKAAVAAVTQTPTRSSKTIIEPKIIRSGEDRNWAFLLKLIANFYEDRGSLIRPANLTTHSNDPKGIHVFVDASNIFIGFHDQLKRARGISQHARVPRVDMSFDALALLMERRRPVAKRVLCGSTPHVAAFDVARNVGYECSILDKVWKARELTERQKYFQEQDNKARSKRASYHSNNGDASNGYTSGGGGGAGSGSDSNTNNPAGTTAPPTHAPEKFVEQGVDEILHLKILESVVDVETPSTMVLATGDAAQAEYSEGFMVMVERALKKGWRVEIVSWSRNISQMYRRQSFRERWGDRFRIVELDDYAEELLDM